MEKDRKINRSGRRVVLTGDGLSSLHVARNASAGLTESRQERRLAKRRSGYGRRPVRRGRRVALLAALVMVAAVFLTTSSTQEPVVHTVASPQVAASGELGLPEPPAEIEDEMVGPAAAELAGDPGALESRIEEIAARYGGVYGVVVSDPATGETVSLGAEETFFAASIGKLPTLLSLYKSAVRGEVNLDEEITMLRSDVRSYGAGVLHEYPVGHTITLREAAYYLMNESDNTAWEMLTRYLGADRIQADLMSIGAYDTAYWAANTTTASDALLMLQKIADPSFTSPKLSGEMVRSMTDTFSEDRIPGGLPPDVRVAHKIGTYEDVFSDAGIVFYEDDGREGKYFIVVFIEGVDETTARAAIREISGAAHHTFAAPHSRP